MRGKLIAVFAVVVLVVGVLSYALTRATLGDLSTPGETPRALLAGRLGAGVERLAELGALHLARQPALEHEPVNLELGGGARERAPERTRRLAGGGQIA